MHHPLPIFQTPGVATFAPATPRRRPEPRVEEVLDAWLRPMTRLDWAGRLDLLEEIDRLLAADPGMAQAFTARLIDALGGEAVTCNDQAVIHLYSSDARHRQDGRAWLAAHRVR
ncbi:MAG: hypothetical protein HY985_11765 [Magnetospirillum sp.]|nr:hypothetical protein [Magnetospirillum sp.]